MINSKIEIDHQFKNLIESVLWTETSWNIINFYVSAMKM